MGQAASSIVPACCSGGQSHKCSVAGDEYSASAEASSGSRHWILESSRGVTRAYSTPKKFLLFLKV